jgi:glutamate/tyrosine decarboxylase-like PLP-dependent enzyme
MHKAAFLGPKAENAAEFEHLMLEVLRDHAFWRRNIHPSDPRLIGEADRQSEDYIETTARIRDELHRTLAELKRNAPLFSPRQIGHMVSDPSIPALVGYFAGMLYNQNNVVAEAAPETVRKEHAYIGALARMIGYPAVVPEIVTSAERRRDTRFSWGHLASGGTSANLEALWVMRNISFYPLAVRLMAEDVPEFTRYRDLEAVTARGLARIRDLSTFELQNLTIESITNFHRDIREDLGREDIRLQRLFEDQLPSVRKIGLASFLQRYNEAFPNDQCRLPKLLVSSSAHYGWYKAADVVGLGVGSILQLSTDAHIRLDVGRLDELIRELHTQKIPTLGVVSITGTTEEGAVDPVHRVEELRSDLEGEGIAFWHHVDAAFGGFLSSMLPRDEEGRALPPSSDDPIVRRLVDDLIGEDVYRALEAVGRVDSVTIDPHKLGFVPYPAGAVLFRDYRVRDAVSYAAPYLPTDDASGFSGFLGQWTLEGSRPGAAAVSCYLAQEALPLTPDGHGRLLTEAVAVNRAIVESLSFRFDARDASWLTFRPFAFPDSIGFCFLLEPSYGIENVDDLNRFTRAIWRHVTVDGREDVGAYQFLLSKTEVSVGKYRHVLRDVIPGLDIDDVDDAETVMLLRVFVMNPFVADWNAESPSFSSLFADYLFDVARTVYPEHVLRRMRRRNGGRRPRLVVALGEESATIVDRLTDAPALEDHIAIRVIDDDLEAGEVILTVSDRSSTYAGDHPVIVLDPEGSSEAVRYGIRVTELAPSTILTAVARALTERHDIETH